MDEFLYKDLSYKIIGLAMEVHRELGSGFLEKVYENSLMALFEENKIEAKQQEKIKVIFHGKVVGDYTADIIVKLNTSDIVKLSCNKLVHMHQDKSTGNSKGGIF